MKSGDTAVYAHPSTETLALYSRGDLPLFTRLRVRHHLGQCLECESEVSLFLAARAELNRESSDQTLTGFEAIADWRSLEREMLGNIAVGVAAARCVDKVGRRHIWLVRASVGAAALTLLTLGWITHIPTRDTRQLETAVRRIIGLDRPVITGTIVQSTPDGISVRTQQATLTILHPASATVSFSRNSGMAARYVDQDTGQVTITNVYGQ